MAEEVEDTEVIKNDMENKEKLQKAIGEELVMLPKEMQEVINTFDYFGICDQIGRKYNLREDEIFGVQTEIALLLVGLTEFSEFEHNLNIEVLVTKSEAKKLTQEILEKILNPIAEKIEEKIKANMPNKNAEIDQNVNFILSGGNYIFLTDSLRRKMEKEEFLKTQAPTKRSDLIDQFKI